MRTFSDNGHEGPEAVISRRGLFWSKVPAKRFVSL